MMQLSVRKNSICFYLATHSFLDQYYLNNKIKINLDFASRLTFDNFENFPYLSYVAFLDVFLRYHFPKREKKLLMHTILSADGRHTLIHCLSAHCIDLLSISVQINLFLYFMS
jgi:hypothetical protein